MSFLQAYSKLLSDIKLPSKISSLAMAIFAFVEIVDFSVAFSRSEVEWDWLFVNRFGISVYLAFVALIGVLFAFRFGLLFGKKKKFVWTAQLFWLFGWLTIIAYQLTTAKIKFGSFFGSRSTGCMDCMYSDTFLNASTNLFFALSAYLFFSSFKQLAFLLFAFVINLSDKRAKLSAK